MKAYFSNLITFNNKEGQKVTRFLYLLAGDASEIASYKSFRGEHYQQADSGHPKWMSAEYLGSVVEMTSKKDVSGKPYWFAVNDHKLGLEALLASMDASNPVRADILAEYKKEYCTFTPETPPELEDVPARQQAKAAKPAKPAKPAMPF